MRKYEIIADNGHVWTTLHYYSNHRAGSNANLKDAMKELENKVGWWAKSFKLIVKTCYLLKD